MKRSAFKTTSKPMNRVSPKRRAYRASEEGQDALDYMGRVRAGGCIICRLFGEQQLSPTQAHHPIHGRYSARKAPDKDCLGICEGHHQGNFDTSKIALHREPDKWKDRYGLDTDYIKEQRKLVGERQ